MRVLRDVLMTLLAVVVVAGVGTYTRAVRAALLCGIICMARLVVMPAEEAAMRRSDPCHHVVCSSKRLPA